jgi:hypothetical protein
MTRERELQPQAPMSWGVGGRGGAYRKLAREVASIIFYFEQLKKYCSQM